MPRFGETLGVGSGDDGPERPNEGLKEELLRERGRLRALRDIGAAMGSTLDLGALLELILERVTQVMQADRSTLYLLDEARGELWSKVAQGPFDIGEGEKEIRLRVGEGLAGWVASTGRSVRIDDVYDDPRFDKAWDQKTGYRTRSVLSVPLTNQRGDTIGVLQVLNKLDGVFGEDDEDLLRALASQATVSIENSKLFLSVMGSNMELLETKEKLERKVAELDVLFEISQVSASALELDELLEGVLSRAMSAIDVEAAAILLADETTGDLRFRAALGGKPEAVKRVQIKAGQGISGWVANRGEPQMVNDVSLDPRHSKDISDQVDYHPKSVLCVPLAWDEGVGALELLNKSAGTKPFSHDDLKLATVIAGHISTAIGLARSRARREKEARLSTIGQFLSGVLHDLRTPMTVINGYVQLLAEEDDESLRKTYAELVKKQVELINSMTHETLAFAKGERKLWVRKVYLTQFFTEVADQLRREMGESGIEVELELVDRGVARFDAHKIQRAVFNLARNASEAIGDDGGRFVIRVDRDEHNDLRLVFTDDGPGIPEAIRSRLFKPFATHGKAHGTGLGLAIVESIVRDHGGELSVESVPGCTAFTISLPTEMVDTSSGGTEPAVSVSA